MTTYGYHLGANNTELTEIGRVKVRFIKLPYNVTLNSGSHDDVTVK